MSRPLDELTQEELWALFPVVLRPYDARYPAVFEQERAALSVLTAGCGVRGIHHIGSTAVPGLLAKPTVDILLELMPAADSAALKDRLAGEWICMRETAEPFRLSYNKGYTPDGFAERVFHLHVVRAGDTDELYFRDYLRHYPAVAAEYARLKQSLLPTFTHDRDGYTAAKAAFVRRYTERARAEWPGRYDYRE